jgi:hypothetical protein
LTVEIIPNQSTFHVKHEDSYSELKFIKAGVPQGSVQGLVLYLLYVHDLPTTLYSTTATFADDTAVMAVRESDENSAKKLQSALNKIAIWTKKWRIKLNESKSVHTDFTNKRITQWPIYINSIQIPYANTAKYLGMTLDTKLRRKEHLKKKRDELNSGKYIGFLDATLSCPFTTNLSYINKFYDQHGVMVSRFGAPPVILTSK